MDRNGLLVVSISYGTVQEMSKKAQAILDGIRALPPEELQLVWRELQYLSNTSLPISAADPIR
jgi:hypothetical protein